LAVLNLTLPDGIWLEELRGMLDPASPYYPATDAVRGAEVRFDYYSTLKSLTDARRLVTELKADLMSRGAAAVRPFEQLRSRHRSVDP
jgi:hypothetical protein